MRRLRIALIIATVGVFVLGILIFLLEYFVAETPAGMFASHLLDFSVLPMVNGRVAFLIGVGWKGVVLGVVVFMWLRRRRV